MRLNIKSLIYSFIIKVCFISSFQLYPSPALASRNHPFEIKQTQKKAIGHFHTKYLKKETRLDFNFSTRIRSNSLISISLFMMLLMAHHIQPAIAKAHQKPITFSALPEPHKQDADLTRSMSSNNSSVSIMLSCEAGARELGKVQAHDFTLLERGSAHSGVFVLDHPGIKSQEDIPKKRVEDFVRLNQLGKLPFEASEEELMKIYQDRFPGFAGVYSFNKRPNLNFPDHMLTQENYRHTLDWLKKNNFLAPSSKPFSNMKTQNFINLLVKVNHLLSGQEVNLNTPFREGLIIIWDDSEDIPNVDTPPKMREYLSQNFPSELPVYNQLCSLLQKLKGLDALTSPAMWDDFMLSLFVTNKTLQNPQFSRFLTFINKYYSINDLTPTQIKERLRVAIADYQRLIPHTPIEACAKLHLDIIEIHPWMDANGRTARLIMNLALRQAGYPPIIVYNRDEYTKAARQSIAQKNSHIFAEYVKKQICKQVELYSDSNFKEGQVLKQIADECMFDCTEAFFEASKSFGL